MKKKTTRRISCEIQIKIQQKKPQASKRVAILKIFMSNFMHFVFINSHPYQLFSNIKAIVQEGG